MNRVRTRFAPSPTGFMHIGNLRTCLYGYLFAKQNNGDFILRIEDTDQERFVNGAIEAIYRTLKIAGIEIDEGPLNGGKYGPYIQSERKDIYLKYAKELVNLGGAYYCFCDKERLDSLTDENGIKKYDKHCLHLTKEEIEQKLKENIPYVIRQNIPTEGVSEYEDLVFGRIAVPNADMEDNILIKSDGMPTYNFANVIDDHLMEISHVMRGMEYLSSTPKYNLIYDAFGWERPKYIHMPPIMKDEHHKLSKRHGDANFEDFYAKGYLPEAIVNYIALLGWHPEGSNQEKMTMTEMIEKFSIKGLSKSGSIFDEVKMAWLNSEYLKSMELDDFVELASCYFDKSAIKGKFDYKKLGQLLQTRIDKLGDIYDKVQPLATFTSYDIELFENKKNKITKEIAKEKLFEILPILKDVEEASWENEYLKQMISALADKKGVKSALYFLPLRLAVTGLQSSPGGATEMAELLGKKESIRRIEFSLELLSK